MLLLIQSGLLEDGRDLLVALLLGLAGKIVILVAGLGFTGKRLPQIGLRLASLQFHVLVLLSKMLIFLKLYIIMYQCYLPE